MKLKISKKVMVLMTLLMFIAGSLSFLSDNYSSYYMRNSSDTVTVSNNVVLNDSMVLYSDLYVKNLVIANNTTLTTNGWSIFSTGTITNYGTIFTGNSNGRNYSQSYGGSGGGSLELTTNSNTGQGYNTKAPGGVGTTKGGSAGNGASASSIVPTPSTIHLWYRSGFTNFLSGAGGEPIHYNIYGTSGTFNGHGKGAFGVYIQAQNILNYGTINAAGSNSSGYPSYGYSGSGGGGVVLFSYENNLIKGRVFVNGGYGESTTSGISGSGGSGEILTVRYNSYPPVNITSAMFQYNQPIWAVTGNYVNYTVTNIMKNNSPIQSYQYLKIDKVYLPFHSVYVTEKFGQVNNTSNSIKQNFSMNLNSYYLYFNVLLSPQALNTLKNGTVNENVTGTKMSNSTTLKNETVTFDSKNFKAYLITEDLNSTAGSYGTSYENLSEVYDSYNGVLINYTYEYYQPTSGNPYYFSTYVQLSSTNMIMGQNHNFTDYLIILIVVAAIITGTILVFRTRSNNTRTTENVNTDLQDENVNSNYESRIQELREMLNKGIITQEYFDESVRNLMRK